MRATARDRRTTRQLLVGLRAGAAALSLTAPEAAPPDRTGATARFDYPRLCR